MISDCALGVMTVQLLQHLDTFLDFFVPVQFKGDAHAKKRVRMFLISHFCGPFLGLPIPLFLWMYDPQPWPQVQILAAQIAAFWLFPVLLKLFQAITPRWR